MISTPAIQELANDTRSTWYIVSFDYTNGEGIKRNFDWLRIDPIFPDNAKNVKITEIKPEL